MQLSGEEIWTVALVVEMQGPVVLRVLRSLRVVLRIMRSLRVVRGIPTGPSLVLRIMRRLPVVQGISAGLPAVMMVQRDPRAVPERVIPHHAAEKSDTLREVSILHDRGILASCFFRKPIPGEENAHHVAFSTGMRTKG